MIRQSLRGPLAALAFALLVAASLTVLRAGQAPAGTVAIDNDDIGGVVTGARGPEAGVWVIAETRDTADPADQERRHRRPGPLPRARSAEGELRRVGPRLRARGFAEGEGGAGQDGEPEGGRRAERRERRRSTTPRSTGSRCCRCRPRAISPAPDRRATAFRRTIKSQGEWIRNIVNTDGCTGCHQTGRQGDARDSGRASARSRTRAPRGIAAFSPGRPAAA